MNTTIKNENLIGPDRVMDVRPIPCSIKHGLIIRTWLELPVGEHFILLNDHDPVPLYYQFSAQWPEAFTWEHLVKGPDEFRVKITKLKAAAPVAEEFLVRGFLLRGWSQSFLAPTGAVVLSSAAWAAVHTQYNWFYMSEIFALGILLGVLRLRNGSTWLTVILHAANNAVAVAVAAVAVG